MRLQVRARLLKVASVRVRLTLWYSLMLAATVTVLGAALYFLLVRTLASEADSDVSTTTLSVARAIGSRVDPDTGEVELQLPEMTVLGDADTFVQVVDLRSGAVLAHSANQVLPELPPPLAPFPKSTVSGGSYQTYDTANARFRIFSRPVFVDGQAIGMVQAARSLTADDRLLDRLRLLLAIVASLGVPTTAAVGWTLAGRALAPIEATNARLADTNARLERSLAVQTRFVADASHELRTPLTTIRANVDVLRWTADGNDPDQLQALADLAGEAERMSRLVDALLMLARADAGRRQTLQPTPLLPLIEETVRHAHLLARGQRVSLLSSEDVTVMGEPDALRQLLLILTDNALKYTPADGCISLGVVRHDLEARLTVSDTGIGIAAQNLSRIFEPFYRADTARETAGSGLGLAIARSIVNECNGRFEVTSQPGGGSTFTVVLPAISARVAGRPADLSNAEHTVLHVNA